MLIHFETTNWKLVDAAKSRSADGRRAMERLCTTYRGPVFALISSVGYSHDAASDLTQEFFQQFLDGKIVRGSDPNRGKFRKYLSASVRNFLNNQYHRENAQKRGGHFNRVYLDPNVISTESTSPASHSPDVVFDRNWAIAVLSQALELVRTRWESKGDGALFEKLHLTLSPSIDSPKYREISEQFSMSIAAVKTRARRLRLEYGECVRNVVRSTLDSDSDAALEEELRTLREVLAADLKSPF